MPDSVFGTHRFLIINYLQGGEDTYQTILPRDTPRINALATIRGSLAFTAAEINNANGAGGLCEFSRLDANHVMHPNLAPLKAIWDAGDMALVHRVGNMWTPLNGISQGDIQTAINDFTGTNPIVFPFSLGGHDFQTIQTATGIGNDFVDAGNRPWSMIASGIGGRLAERYVGFTGASPLPITHQFGPGIFTDHWPLSQTAQKMDLPRMGQAFSRNNEGNALWARALQIADTLNSAIPTDPRDRIMRNADRVSVQSTGFYGPNVGVPFNGGSWAVNTPFSSQPGGAFTGNIVAFQESFLSIARAIEWRLTGGPTTLPTRTVFVVNWGDFDTHDTQGKTSGRLPDLHNSYARAIRGFRDAMINLGVWNDCLVLNVSEFARTLPINGGFGTDHAWARSMMAFGGGVRGLGKSGSTGHFGALPSTYGSLSSGNYVMGSHDVFGGQIGLGSMIPEFSWEQGILPALTWFGCNAADLNELLPRRALFGAAPTYMV
ncbi:Protein of unknown function DUF1501 [uncultured Caudovirales phage]|uniref:DUF1501 domain-containing protein n=1 Tax=uncultured Caudovirales phage TaxID=2100421 RepID=A0A6J5M742_9CAUD|nr:Protein of unknown function DUF1501 [uncultured Caudovirales phage]